MFVGGACQGDREDVAEVGSTRLWIGKGLESCNWNLSIPRQE